MGSKQVLDEGKLADQVVQAARTHAAEIARRLAARYVAAGVKHAPSAQTLEAVLLADAALLEHDRNELHKADKALALELGDDAPVFAERDRAAGAVRAILVELREGVQTNCGASEVQALGFAGETPRDPVVLAELGGDVLDKVKRHAPKATRKGAKYDAHTAVEGLDGEVRALAKANGDVRRERSEEQAARAARDATWTAFERGLRSTVDGLEARLRSVALDDLADRLVPAARAAAASTDEGGGGSEGGQGSGAAPKAAATATG